MSTSGDDMDLGGRVSLEDGFTTAAVRIAQSMRNLYGSFTDGARRIGASVRQVTGGMRAFAAAPRWMVVAVGQYRQEARRWALDIASDFPRAVGRAGAAVVRFGATADRIFSRLGGVVQRGIAGLLNGLGGFGRLLSPAGIISGFVGLVRGSIEAGSQIENLSLAFTQLMGSADAARQHLTMLRGLVLGTPLELTQAAELSRTLQAAGFQAADVHGLITTIGDAAFTSGKGFARGMQPVARIFGQIHMMGTVTLGQIRQLNNAGVQATQILMERLHLTGAQIRNIARSGIPAERVLAALREGMQERYGGGMARAAGTLSARISDLNDALTLFQGALYDNIGPTIIGFFNELGMVINSDNIMRAAWAVGKVVVTVLRLGRALLAPLLGAFGDVGEQWAGATNRTILPLRDLFHNIHDIVYGISALLGSEDSRGIGRIPARLQRTLVDEGLWPLVLHIAQWGDRVRNMIVGFVGGAVDEFRRFGTQAHDLAERLGLTHGPLDLTAAGARQMGHDFAHTVTRAIELRVALAAIGPAATILSGTFTVLKYTAMAASAASDVLTVSMLANPFVLLTAAIVGTIAGMVLVVKHYDAIHARLRAMGPAKAGLLTAAVGATNPLIGLTYQTMELRRQWPAFAASVGHAWARIKTALASAGHVIGAAWHRAVTVVQGALARVWSAVKVAAAQWFAPFKLIGEAIILVAYVIGVRVVAAFVWLGTRIGQAFAAVGAMIWSAISPIVHMIGGVLAGAWDTFSSAMVSAAGAVAGAFRHLGKVLHGVWTTVTGVLGRVWAVLAGVGARTAKILRGAFATLWQGLESGLTSAATAIGNAFSRMGDMVLSPLRSIAREIVALFNALPAGLRPASLTAMAADLDRFAHGPVQSPATAAEHAGAQAARAPGSVPAAATARTAAAAQAGRPGPGAAPTIVVQPAAVPAITVAIDGRAVATAVAAHQSDDHTRRGGTGDDE